MMLTRKSRKKDPVEYEVTKTEDEWREQLPSERYAVLRKAGTEPAWSGELLHVDGAAFVEPPDADVRIDDHHRLDMGREALQQSAYRARFAAVDTIVETSPASLPQAQHRVVG